RPERLRPDRPRPRADLAHQRPAPLHLRGLPAGDRPGQDHDPPPVGLRGPDGGLRRLHGDAHRLLRAPQAQLLPVSRHAWADAGSSERRRPSRRRSTTASSQAGSPTTAASGTTTPSTTSVPPSTARAAPTERCHARASVDAAGFGPGTGPGLAAAPSSSSVRFTVEYEVWPSRYFCRPWSCSICSWIVDSCCWIWIVSEIVLALAMSPTKTASWACQLAIRAWRSTYSAVTSSPVSDSAVTLPRPRICPMTASS